MAFGMPVSLTLDDLMAGRTQPMGAGERTKAGGAVATLPMGLRSAVAVTDKAAEPRHAAPAHRGAAAFGVQTLEAGMRRTSDFGLLGASLARPIASKPALIATRAAAPKAVTKSQSAAAAIPVRDAPAKFVEPIMIWGSVDLPKDVMPPQAVPRTPFFLRSTHRCLLADPARAMAVAVDALIEMDCDVSMESPEPTLSCTLIHPGGSCEFTMREWVVPAADDCELASVFELSPITGDRYSFHDAFLRFSAALASAAEASGMVMASDCNDPRVAPIVPVDPAIKAAVKAARTSLPERAEPPAQLPRADTPTDSARGKDTESTSRPKHAGGASTGAGASVTDDEEADMLQTSFDVIASMLGSSRDDVREEGAARVVAAIMAGDEAFAGTGTGICRSSLRRRDVGRKLINALVRAQAGSTCHSQAANALALMAQCADCAADMIDNGAVFALASVIMVPCKRQTVRLRRNAARAISRLASTSDAIEHAKACNVVPYLRFVVGHCPDRQFRRDADAAANALDPEGDVSSVDVTGIDVEASALEALGKARVMARGASA